MLLYPFVFFMYRPTAVLLYDPVISFNPHIVHLFTSSYRTILLSADNDDFIHNLQDEFVSPRVDL